MKPNFKSISFLKLAWNIRIIILLLLESFVKTLTILKTAHMTCLIFILYILIWNSFYFQYLMINFLYNDWSENKMFLRLLGIFRQCKKNLTFYLVSLFLHWAFSDNIETEVLFSLLETNYHKLNKILRKLKKSFFLWFSQKRV